MGMLFLSTLILTLSMEFLFSIQRQSSVSSFIFMCISLFLLVQVIELSILFSIIPFTIFIIFEIPINNMSI